MRKISAKLVEEKVAELFGKIAMTITEDARNALKEAFAAERASLARKTLEVFLENAEISEKEGIPYCQDTGMAVVFVEMGQEVLVVGGYIEDAINRGVERAYRENPFRKSVVNDPLLRKNTGTNTPAVVHYRIVPGDRLRIRAMAKGFGSENKSALKMLVPADGKEGIVEFVVSVVKNAGPDACPPFVVGVGIGGTMEMCAKLAKEALFRKIGEHSPKPHIAQLERELLERINALRIGPGGFGGRTTALWVAVEVYPTHIAGLPVAVNLLCHAVRHGEVVI